MYSETSIHLSIYNDNNAIYGKFACNWQTDRLPRFRYRNTYFEILIITSRQNKRRYGTEIKHAECEQRGNYLLDAK